MQQHTIHIKGMVCQRCITAVQKELEALGYQVTHLELALLPSWRLACRIWILLRKGWRH